MDKKVFDLIDAEKKRQSEGLELIPSENYVSREVLEAMGSVLTNKYSEGYPNFEGLDGDDDEVIASTDAGHRYYGGQENTNQIERLAIARARRLFNADHANVQPHSGAQANNAVYNAWLEPGDTVLGMSLDCGGHLTHGSSVNASGRLYHFVPYGVTPDGFLDYDELERLAKEHRPKMIVAGASAYPRIIDFSRIGHIARSVGALFLVDMAHIAGLVAAGQHPSPLPHADIVTTTTHKTLRGPRGGMILCKEPFAKAIDRAVFPGNQGGPLMHVIAAKAVCFGEALRPEFKAYQEQIVKNSRALSVELLKRGFDLVSGGTDNHLMLVDLRPFGLTGREMEKRLDEVYITVNKNAIPNDPEKVSVTSGVRIGTAAVTSRGFTEENMAVVAELIYWAATDFENKADRIRERVNELCREHSIY